mmetsp:Transcript_7613/g.9389  ORF Transcript_7613/g.9389 Transcript_7613/m.9389 type:complete len:82 (+) Transcript_7613:90-335(+)
MDATNKNTFNDTGRKHKKSLQIIITSLIIISLAYIFWNDLVIQMGGSQAKAGLIVMFALVCGGVDLNDMTGQPEGDHDHDD